MKDAFTNSQWIYKEIKSNKYGKFEYTLALTE